jgi:hypothetical protein
LVSKFSFARRNKNLIQRIFYNQDKEGLGCYKKYITSSNPNDDCSNDNRYGQSEGALSHPYSQGNNSGNSQNSQQYSSTSASQSNRYTPASNSASYSNGQSCY